MYKKSTCDSYMHGLFGGKMAAVYGWCGLCIANALGDVRSVVQTCTKPWLRPWALWGLWPWPDCAWRSFWLAGPAARWLLHIEPCTADRKWWAKVHWARAARKSRWNPWQAQMAAEAASASFQLWNTKTEWVWVLTSHRLSPKSERIGKNKCLQFVTGLTPPHLYVRVPGGLGKIILSVFPVPLEWGCLGQLHLIWTRN